MKGGRETKGRREGGRQREGGRETKGRKEGGERDEGREGGRQREGGRGEGGRGTKRGQERREGGREGRETKRGKDRSNIFSFLLDITLLRHAVMKWITFTYQLQIPNNTISMMPRGLGSMSVSMTMWNYSCFVTVIP